MNLDEFTAESNDPESYAFSLDNDFSQSVLLKLKIGDQVNFYVSNLPNEIYENYADGCKTGDITHSCSAITGEYVDL